MSQPASIKRNLGATWISHVINLALAVVLMPFILHTMGDSLYGLWVFLNSIAGYSGLLSFGLSAMVARYVATHHAKKEWDELNEVLTVVFGVYLTMCAVVMLIASILAWVAPLIYDWGSVPMWEVRTVILLLGVNVSVGFMGSLYTGTIMGLQRFDIARLFATFAGLTRLGLIFYFLQFEHKLLTLAWVCIAVTVVEHIGSVVYAKRQLPTLKIRKRNWNASRAKECFSFGSFTFLESFAQRLIYATDTIVIGIMLGPKLIVPFVIASRLSEMLTQPIMQVGAVSMPKAGTHHAQQDQVALHRLISQSLGLAFVLTTGLFIGIWYFGGMVIETWIGEGYEHSHLLLCVLFAAQVIAVPVSVFRKVLFATGRVKVPALMYLAEAFANLGLTLILIGKYELLGVALGTAIPLYIVELGIILPYAFKHLEFTMSMVCKTLAPFLVPLAALWVYSAGVCHYFPDAMGWFAVLGIAGGGGIVLGLTWGIVHTISTRSTQLSSTFGNDQLPQGEA